MPAHPPFVSARRSGLKEHEGEPLTPPPRMICWTCLALACGFSVLSPGPQATYGVLHRRVDGRVCDPYNLWLRGSVENLRESDTLWGLLAPQPPFL
jgi:hypothetical protein